MDTKNQPDGRFAYRKMQGRNLDEEFSLENLRDLQSRRRARERSDNFALVERAAFLPIVIACVIHGLFHGLDASPITALGYIVGARLLLKKRADPGLL